MAKAKSSPQPSRRKVYSPKPFRQYKDLLAWWRYSDAFEAYTREPEPEPCVALSVDSWSGFSSSADTEPLELRHLYVLEPKDLCEFTLAEVVQAWQHRHVTCGSIEGAAELLALYRLATGEDESYTGAGHFLAHPDVLAIFPPDLEPESPATAASKIGAEEASSPTPAPLSLDDVRKLSSTQLMQVWERRPDSLASIEAAAETLASLRWLSSGDADKTSFQHFLNHALIQDLEDFLPRELYDSPAAVSTSRELELLKEDRRELRAQFAVVRTGQRDFRALIWQRYGGTCCVTGCSIERLVEAAHIIPYRGAQTDEQDNGLLLRVDIHRLFDDYLVSVDPERLLLVVSQSITDPAYKDLQGTRLFQLTPQPRKLYLEDHYRRFHRMERQRDHEKA